MISKYLNIKLARMINKAPKSPAIVHIEITDKCDLKCKMCDIWKRRSKELSTKQWINLAKELGDIGVTAVGITGGEPLLRNDIAEIIKALKSQNMIVHLNTNGTIPNTAERLKNSGIDSVTVSIDFFGEKHDKNRGMKDCFKKAVQTLRDLKKAGIKRVGIGTLIMGQDTKHLEKLTKLAFDLNIFISFAGFDLGLTNKQKESRKKNFRRFIEGVNKIKELRKKYKNIMVLPAYLNYMKRQSIDQKRIDWCYAGFATCIIRANGDVQPCYSLNSAGNIKKETFKSIWNSDKMRKLTKRCSKICFANCIIEPSLIFSNPLAAVQFYALKWRRVKS